MNDALTVPLSAPASRSGPTPRISFMRSIPPVPPMFAERVSQTLSALALSRTAADALRIGVAGGSEQDRAAGAAWLSPRFGESLPADRILLTNGTQGALLLLFEHFVGAGGLIVAESLSYTPLDRLARRAHVRLKGLPIDEQGLIPEAFEAACRIDKPRALYCNPTMHNPTTAIMSEARRFEIAAIARTHGVAIFEDDPLGRLHPGTPRPIAALAPDVCWYMMGVTKCLAHGIRIAYVVAPSGAAATAFLAPIQDLSFWFPTPLSAAILTRWIEHGVAEELTAAIGQELLARQQLAARILSTAQIASPTGGMHLWLTLPPALDRHEFAQTLTQREVGVRPADMFAVDDSQVIPNAVRLSLSSPLHRAEVEAGLRIVARTLGEQPGAGPAS